MSKCGVRQVYLSTCSRGSWPALQSNRVPIEKLGILFAIDPEMRCICRVSVLLFFHPWLFDDLVAMGCDHIFRLENSHLFSEECLFRNQFAYGISWMCGPG